MSRKSFYDILEVSQDASIQTIADAFKRLALKYHPDMVVHLDKRSQRKALKRMQSISEAFATLRNQRSRDLYDRCLREGLDFAVESWHLGTPPSTAEGQAAVARAAAQTSRAPNPAPAKKVLDAILNLPGMTQHDCSSSDEYFDFIVSGRLKAHRYLIHLKSLDAVGVEDLLGIINYADQLQDVKQTLLTKAYHSFVIVGRRLDDTLSVRATAEQYNARMRRAQRGQPVRGLVLVTEGEAKPFVPYGEYLYPSFGSMLLKR